MKITISFFLIFGIILIGLYIPSYNGTQKTYSCKMHMFIDLNDGQIVPRKIENFGFSLSEGSFWFKTKIKFDNQSKYLQSIEEETLSSQIEHKFSNRGQTIVYYENEGRFHLINNTSDRISVIQASCKVVR